MKPQHKIEVQDIFKLYGDEYRRSNRKTMSTGQHKAMRQIEFCRTAALGGHKEICGDCEKERISYNSCRNRHCPKCQFLKREKWLEERLKDFLPVNYFHVVFTLPDTINAVALGNRKTVYNILFRSVSETLKNLSNDKKHLEAKTGFICILHTWGQNLMFHPHVHCIVTGGGLSSDNDKWIDSSSDFLFPIKVMSKLFRGKFLYYLKESYGNGKLKYHEDKKSFSSLLNVLYKKEWVVYSKPSFNNPETVFRYLSNYTHRIAISNHRIIKLQDDKVYFKWKDYSDSSREKVMAIDAIEFIRRFLLHVLPDRFVKIRHYGLFSNRCRKDLLKKCRKIMRISKNEFKESVETWKEMLLRITGFDVEKCPYCGKGKMILVETLLPEYCNSPP
jgi:hypothetical protein